MSGFNGDRGAREAEALRSMPDFGKWPYSPTLNERIAAMWPFRFHRHKWGKWQKPFLVNQTDPYSADPDRVIKTAAYQQRECETCGKVAQRIAGVMPDAEEDEPCVAIIEPKP